jgi:Thioredoxin
MVTRERFQQGLTLRQYLDQMQMNRDRFRQVMDRVPVTPAPAGASARNVLVITEDWCGTALSSVPVLARLVAGRPEIEVRVFLRDANLDLMDQYLKDGKYRSIPVIVVFDADMKERGRVLERTPPGQDVVEYLTGLLRA